MLDDLRVEALFASHLQPSDRPSWSLVRDTVHKVGIELGEVYCSARLAQEFGDHPDTAVTRMRWCRTAVAEAFAPFLV
jgi:hypothetical protein